MRYDPSMSPCQCCTKSTTVDAPWTICPRCSKVIEKWTELQKRSSESFRTIRDIEQMKFKGKGDLAYHLNCVGERVANIQEEIEWMINVLQNISTQMELDDNDTKREQ